MTAPTAPASVDQVRELRDRIAAAQLDVARAQTAVDAAERELGDALADDVEPGVRLRGTLAGSRQRLDEAQLLVATLERRLAALTPALADGRPSASAPVLVRAISEVREPGSSRMRAPGEIFPMAAELAATAVSGGTVGYVDAAQRRVRRP